MNNAGKRNPHIKEISPFLAQFKRVDSFPTGNESNQELNKTQTKTDSIIAAFGRKLKSEIKTGLRARIDTYEIAAECIDNKYSKEEIKTSWESHFSDELIKEVCTNILQKFIQTISAEMEEMSRQLSFILESDADFEGFEADSLPWGDILKVGGILTGIGGVILIACSFPILGAIVGIIGGLGALIAKIFKTRGTKIRELQEKLDESFEENIENLTERFREHCQKNVYPLIRGKLNDAISSQEDLLKICDDFLQLNQKLSEIAEDNRKKLGPHIKQLVSEQKMLLRTN